jgi:intracellular sulfur oxidation DsrE/DsrF family protein
MRTFYTKSGVIAELGIDSPWSTLSRPRGHRFHPREVRSMKIVSSFVALMLVLSTSTQWPNPVAPVVPSADGYVAIPGAAVPPQKSRVYKAVFDATRAADKPTQLVPALNMIGSELNAFRAAEVPPANVRFAVVFHGAALDGILDPAHYKAKFGVDNPNLEVLAQLEKSGVELLVCGQNLAFDHVDPKSLAPQVKVASDALIVLMTYQNDGYALLSF